MTSIYIFFKFINNFLKFFVEKFSLKMILQYQLLTKLNYLIFDRNFLYIKIYIFRYMIIK